MNKIDLPSADPEPVAGEIEDILGLPADDVLRVSAKTGVGIEELIERIVERVPPPAGDPDAPLRALIFDSWFDPPYVGVVLLVRVVDGRLAKGERIKLRARGSEHEVQDLALIDPHPRSALALSIRAFVIEPYRIPSGSMLPTLLIGDHLFVNKFLYGIKIPFTDWRTPGLREPQRGDVVVFTIGKDGRGIHPADQRPDLPHDQFVKRLVGLPGDTIEVRSGDRYVNGKAMETKDTGADFRDDAGRTLRIANETLDRSSGAAGDVCCGAARS